MRRLGPGMPSGKTRDRIRKKEVSVREVLEAAVARAGAAQHLGAVFEPTYDRAREFAARQPVDAPFAGVPTFIKDMIQVRGVRTTWGSRATGRYVSRRTDAIAARMEESGLVMLGKSACPEVALSVTTEPLGWPPCRNPRRRTLRLDRPVAPRAGRRPWSPRGSSPSPMAPTREGPFESRPLAAASSASSRLGFVLTGRGRTFLPSTSSARAS